MGQAPDVTNIGGTYYLYYAVSAFGSQDSAIGLATRYVYVPKLSLPPFSLQKQLLTCLAQQ